MKILSMKDRVKVSLGDVTFIVAPLTANQRAEISNCFKLVEGQKHYNEFETNKNILKYSLKGLEGVEYENGSKLELKFEDDCLTEESIDDVYSVCENLSYFSIQNLLQRGAMNNGKLVNPINDEEIEGVALELLSKEKLVT